MNIFSLGNNNNVKTKYQYINDTFGKKVSSISYKDTFMVNANDLIKCELKPFWGQRASDEIHINTIANGISMSNILFHPIILANIIPKKEYYILDGQHRYAALMRLSETQRSKIKVQVDVLNFEMEDDKWIIKQYEWINTSKGISKIDLDREQFVSQLVNELSNTFGYVGAGYKKIDEYAPLRNKQNSKVVKSELKKELLNRYDKLGQDAKQKIIDYNEKCCLEYENKFNGVRIGKNVKEECVSRKFWLGINFPAWIDEIFN